MHKTIFLLAFLSGLVTLAAAAEEAGSANDSKQKPPEDRFKLYGWIQAGITANPACPDDHQNFGRLFDDRSNEPLLNQIAITAERTLDPKATRFDWGFKVQGLFGTDARFIHSLGIFDDTMRSTIEQPDLPEAYVNLHFPILTEGGLDLKAGKFVTLEGAETIDPRTNFFYSHSYIFNFGIPFNHTGALATWHATKWLDVMSGVTRGVNTSIDDNNSSAAFHGGFGLNFSDGKLTVLASSHIGPETPHNNVDYRYLNDITITWKITDKWASITDLNYIRDDATDASGGGVAQYVTYTINQWLSAGVRVEIWRDADNFFVTQYADNHDPMRALMGEPITDPWTVTGGATTYGALTLGLNIKPTAFKPFSEWVIRPEIRGDYALNGNHPFNDSCDRGMLTFALSTILSW